MQTGTQFERREHASNDARRSAARELHSKWNAAGAGEDYRTRRFGRRRGLRDPRQVARLLERFVCSEAAAPTILDAPSGAGRIAPAVTEQDAARYVGLDASPAMLKAHPLGRQCVAGRLESLPFADASFDAVVACRLLHHVHSETLLDTITTELVRVSRRCVIASYWEVDSWPGWRRRAGWSRADRAGRNHRTRKSLEASFARAGARVVEVARPAGWLSAQAFAVALRNR